MLADTGIVLIGSVAEVSMRRDVWSNELAGVRVAGPRWNPRLAPSPSASAMDRRSGEAIRARRPTVFDLNSGLNVPIAARPSPPKERVALLAELNGAGPCRSPRIPHSSEWLGPEGPHDDYEDDR